MKISAKRFGNFSSQSLLPSAIFLPTAWHLCTRNWQFLALLSLCCKAAAAAGDLLAKQSNL